MPFWNSKREHPDRIRELEDENGRLRRELSEVRAQRDKLEKEKDELFRCTFDQVAVGIAHVAPEGRFLRVNDRFCEIFGYATEEICDARLSDLLHPGDSVVCLLKSHKVLSGRISSCAIERRFVRKDGATIWCNVALSSFNDSLGESKYLIAVVEDVSRRKNSERKLRASERQLRVLIESSPIGIRISRDGKVAYANPKFVRMYGYDDLAEIVGKNVESLAAPEERDKVLRRQAERLAGKDVVSHYELKARKKNGVLFDVEMWLELIDYEGAPAILAFVVDTTAQKQFKEHLARSQKMEALGTLAGGIAHDFNNILSAIMGYTELVGLDLDRNSDSWKNLEQVMKASNRAKDLIRHILSFSRQTKKEREPIQIAPIVKETSKLLKASLPSFIEIRTDVHKNLGYVLADPTQIHQIMLNLCTNAAFAMRETGGTLSIALKQIASDDLDPFVRGQLSAGTYLTLSVSDTGAGIAPEISDRIFEPYFTTKSQEEGVGLGLFTVHGIVSDYQGAIAVESEPGKGAAFHVYLPVSEGVSPGAETVHASSLPKGKERILIVDDEMALANLERQFLEHLGYDVESSTSSLEALKKFEKRPGDFDLVITDMTMPDMTGDKLALEMMEIRPDIPIIMCTGFSEKMSEASAKRLGIKAYVRKPLMIGELSEAVRKALDGLS